MTILQISDGSLTLTFGGGFDEVDGAEADGALGWTAVQSRDEAVRDVVVHPLPLRLHSPEAEGNNTVTYNNTIEDYNTVMRFVKNTHACWI